MQASCNSEIIKTVYPMLSYFVEQFNADKIDFPILPSTYSLWRRYAYETMTKLQQFKTKQNEVIYEFYLQSELGLLKIFIQKILKKFNVQQSIKPINASLPADVSVDNQIIDKYNRQLQIHTFYGELFQDLIRLPYLSDIFCPSRNYKLSQKYAPNIIRFNEKQQVTQKFSNGLLNKGIGLITQKIFTKTFLLQASSMAIRLNPLAMVASFAFAQLISRYRKDKKGQQISQKIAEALRSIEQQAQQLKNAYDECIGLLGPGLREGGQKKKYVIKMIKSVMIQDWLEIQSSKDEDGWEVVVLHGSKQNPKGIKQI